MTVRLRMLGMLLLVATVCGCVSPHTKMEQYDLGWYAEDRYRFADAMPARDKEEAFKKIEAYWETMETIGQIEDADTVLTLDGESMKRDAARRHVKDRLRRTEKIADITSVDYCGRMTVWTMMIPVCILKTPFDAACIFAESPVSNIEW